MTLNRFFKRKDWSVVHCLLALLAISAAASIREQRDVDSILQQLTVVADTDRYIPLFGDSIPWNLNSDDGSYAMHDIHMPTDVIQDLLDAQYIGHPFYETNFLQQKHVWAGIGTRTSPPQDVSTPDYVIPQMTPRVRTWIYSTHFTTNHTVDKPLQKNYNANVLSMHRILKILNDDITPSFLLVVEGIKMGAHISINGVHIGTTTNQFRRYIFHIHRDILQLGPVTNIHGTTSHFTLALQHQIHIRFDPSIPTHGRYMAASGGWDWAPYSKTCDQQQPYSSAFSFGVIKPIYIIPVQHVFLSHVVTKTYYLGNVSKVPMTDGPQADFQLVVDIHLSFIHNNTALAATAKDTSSGTEEAQYYGEILLRASFLPGNNQTVIIPVNGTVVRYRIIVPKDRVELWWPMNMGNQTLYDLEISYRNIQTSTETRWIKRKIGFRTVALVTYNEYDNDHPVDSMEEGSGFHGMYFRINGALVWCRGANLVPAHQLISDDESYVRLAHSTADTGMNTIRIWGGGELLPDSFYDVANEKGLLIFHDLLFVEEQGHGARATDDVEAEIRGIIRRLSSHPSIILWNGCNECKRNTSTDSDVYSSFVMKIVSDEDDTRPIWPNSPSKTGWKTGVYKIDGRPNGKRLTYADDASHDAELEYHGPYGHGWSKHFPTVNGFVNYREYHPEILINITRTKIGPQFQSTFISEFGVSTMSSFESMSAFISENHWGIHGGAAPDHCTHVYEELNDCVGNNSFAQRNYPCDNHIYYYFGDIDLNDVGREPFQRQLYLCMIAQLLWTKSVIETYRASNSYGTLIWQLNENWPTGGWGLVEYGGRLNEQGQVFGGRWKPAMHYLKQSLFQDVFFFCGKGGTCLIRNDGICAFTGRIVIDSWHLSTGISRSVMNRDVTVQASGGHEYLALDNYPFKQICGKENILMILLRRDKDMIVEEYPVLCEAPKGLVGLSNDAEISITSIRTTKDGIAEVYLNTSKVALFVTLTSSLQGRFEPNSFALHPSFEKVVRFLPLVQPPVSVSSSFDEKAFRVEHMGMYM